MGTHGARTPIGMSRNTRLLFVSYPVLLSHNIQRHTYVNGTNNNTHLGQTRLELTKVVAISCRDQVKWDFEFGVNGYLSQHNIQTKGKHFINTFTPKGLFINLKCY
jgi:hypothetical protein